MTRLSFILILSTAASPAQAADNDISLRGLGRPADDSSLSDPATKRFRALAGELALALAPKPLAPAETSGMSGFGFGVSSSLTDINQGAAYWRGQPGNPVLERGDVPGVLWTPTLNLRKGLPYSTEIGLQTSYLTDSEMFMLGADVRVALHEHYVKGMPSIALRAAVGRLIGAADLDLVTFEADVLVSKAFAMFGTMRLTPFLGYGQVFMHATSQILDETPYLVSDPADQSDAPNGSLYSFPTLNMADHVMHRIVGGVRAQLFLFELLYEVDLGIISFSDKDVLSHSLKIGFDV